MEALEVRCRGRNEAHKGHHHRSYKGADNALTFQEQSPWSFLLSPRSIFDLPRLSPRVTGRDADRLPPLCEGACL